MKMKKFLYMPLLAAAMLCVGCAGEEDDLFDASAAERLNEASDKYSALLESSQGGWVIQYYPTNDGELTTGTGYLWCVKFNKDQSVLVGMNNYFSGNSYKEETSGWEVITDNGPVLSFNTQNSLVHAFSDPDIRTIPNNDENVWGVGVGGDYEFVIVDAPEDHSYVMLKGKKRGTYNLMTPLSDTITFKDYLADIDAFQKARFPSSAVNPVYLNLGDSVSYETTLMSTGRADMFPKGGDAITETTSAHVFLITKRGEDYYLRFRRTYSAGDEDYQEFVYDKENDQFNSVDGKNGSITGPVPTEFLARWMEDGHKWALVNNSTVYEMSESLATAYQEMAKQLTAASWTITELVLRVATEADAETKAPVKKAFVDLSVRNSKRQTKKLTYRYDYQASNGGCTISYVEPVVTDKDKTASTILQTVPALNTMLELLSATYQAESKGNKMVLNNMLVKATDNADNWFNVQFQR